MKLLALVVAVVAVAALAAWRLLRDPPIKPLPNVDWTGW
jgi:hypothetical protein